MGSRLNFRKLHPLPPHRLGGTSFCFAASAQRPQGHLQVRVAVFEYAAVPLGPVAVRVTGAAVALTHVAVPFVTSCALLIVTSKGSLELQAGCNSRM